MSEPVNLDAPRDTSPADPAGTGLSWREFFVRLGNGTLHEEVAEPTCRDTAVRNRKTRARQTAPVAR